MTDSEELHGPEPSAEVRAHRQRLTDEARKRHDALDATIEELERALASAGGQRARAWTERVERQLGRVQDAIRAHAEGVEERDGLFDEIEDHDPRLADRIAALKEEHADLLEQAAVLDRRLQPDRDADVGLSRREASELLVRLRAHRAAEADLVYEAFWTDLGAPD